ncbi:MAG: urea ABC transporter permease subunit UrtB [Roseobacter sp.]
MTFFRILLCAISVWLFAPNAPVLAQSLEDILATHQKDVERASRKTIDPIISDLIDSGLPQVPTFLERWQNKEVWMRKDDKSFFYVDEKADGTFDLIALTSGEAVDSVEKKAIKELKPNSGVRSVIAVALVQFQLSDPDPERRLAALQAIERDAEESQLAPLRNSIAVETDPDILARKRTLERLLTAQFGETTNERVAAIEALSTSLSVETRGALNPILASSRYVAEQVAQDRNVARILTPGSPELSQSEAYALMVSAQMAPPLVDRDTRDRALIAHITDGQVGSVSLATLNTEDARDRAYATLAANSIVPPAPTQADIEAAVMSASFFDLYAEPDRAVTAAAEIALASIETRVGWNQTLDLVLDGVSLASIYFLAAIGLAITFGVMRVINMAHGEFIMMGAYTGYVVQLFVTDYTVSLVIALPLAFAVTFAAGVAMERLVIRHLYHRPLETLLATFGISIALQQLAKNIFGTQARPLTSPGWLDGAWVLNDVVSISYIRIAIFVLGIAFLILLLFILNRTRLGLEVRAVTQNPRMAASMGINPDRINMLTFGLGSGIAGIAGVAIGLYAKVTSELGSDYIVQSFMTVVVGGVGNIWGTLLGATLIGNLQKLIEWFNPSNTLAAQTYMILFIILFIQIRPRGIIALKGRAAGD